MTDAEAIVAWVADEAEALEGRVHPIDLPPDPILPAATFQVVSRPGDPTQDGPGLERPRVRFKVWTETFEALAAPVAALRAAFDYRRDGPFQVSIVELGPDGRDAKTRRYWQIVDVLGWQPA
jgi:hypothetical protein